MFSSIQFSRSVVSDSLRPHELHVLCEFVFKYNILNSKFIFKWKYIAYFCHTVLPKKELIFENLRYEEFVRLWLPIAEICQQYCNYYTLKLIVTVGTNRNGTQFCVTQEHYLVYPWWKLVAYILECILAESLISELVYSSQKLIIFY